MIVRTIFTSSILAIAVLGCTSTPERVAELDNARIEVNRVANEPMATEAAGEQVRQAQQALTNADSALKNRAPVVDVKQYAFVATRHAQIAQAQINEAQARKTIEAGEAARNRVIIDAREQETMQAQAAAQQAQAAARQANSEVDALKAQLVALQAMETDRGLVLTLGDVLFETGKSNLQPGAMSTLDRLAEFMRENEAVVLMIEGHTDNVGGEAFNLDLSRQRGLAVENALRARGVSAQRMTVTGLGENYPVASNESAGGRQDNRRVEILFSDQEGAFGPGVRRSVSR